MSTEALISQLSENRCFGGWHRRYQHRSQVLQCEMTFAIFLPEAAILGQPVPVLYWLSGLTCSDENFMQKAGALRLANALGMAIVAPDTSPRGEGVADDPDGAYDLGLGAGFYLNATQAPWQPHYQMYDYVLDELPALVEQQFAVNDRRSIAGHSMGGHGALVLGLRNPQRYCAISAFSPIANPVACPWGRKAFSHYLGEDTQAWQQYDASLLMAQAKTSLPTLVDQGADDGFLAQQLLPERLLAAAQESQYPLQYRQHPGYDHSYFFISSFIEDHLHFHHLHLC